jgi:hypothetical protein
MVRHLLVVTALACALINSGAAASVSPGVGNSTGGVADSSSCRHGGALVGFVGAPALLFGNLIVGRVRAICAPPPGLFSSPQRIVSASIGTLGTQTRRHRCPDGMVVTGLLARAGDLVDRLRMMCRTLDFEQQRKGPISFTSATGGHGGKMAIVQCPRREYATGFLGDVRRGNDDVIDFLQLNCV